MVKSLRPLVLLTLALLARVLTVGASTDSSFVRRRLAGHDAATIGEGKATVVSDAVCPLPCLPFLPTCCQFPGIFGLPGPFYCANTAIDILNCGTCGTVCPLFTFCCNGKCSNLLTDPNNCGLCGTKCPSGDTCRLGLCKYAT
ncbi:unnamed protein product [Calypogeia fissa]